MIVLTNKLYQIGVIFMHKHKKLGVIFLFLGVVLFLTGCGNSAKDRYADNDFNTALVKGLEKRWDLNKKTDDTDVDDLTKADYKEWVQAELDQVSKFRNEKFKSAKLQEAALRYISSLHKQKAALKYFSSNDEFTKKWDDAYDNRSKAITDINKIHKIKVPKDYQSNLDELLGNGKPVSESDAKDEKLAKLLKTIEFKPEPKEYPDDDYTTYSATVTNNTGFEIKSFSGNVKIKDKSGITVATESINTENWSNGDKVKFTFSTDQEVATYNVIKDYVDY